MNTLNTLYIDVITREVTGALTGGLPDLDKLNNDLILNVIFQNNAVNLDPDLHPDVASLQSLLLLVSDPTTGEIIVQSDSWARSGGTYYLHALIASESLENILSSQDSVDLLGEIQWVMTNPFFNSPNGNIGPYGLRTSSKNFNLTISADIG